MVSQKNRTFGSRRDGKSATDLGWLRELNATDPQTALADQVAELLAREPDDLPAAVVLVTDGRENASQKTTQCWRLNCRHHAWRGSTAAAPAS